MHDFIPNGLAKTVFLLLVVMLSIDDGLELPVLGQTVCFLWVVMVDSLGMCDSFLSGSALQFCGRVDGLEMGQCSEKLMACVWCLVCCHGSFWAKEIIVLSGF